MVSDRQNKILEIIEKYEIETQEELGDKLRESGFNVNQATVSRDIRALRLYKKKTGKGSFKYAAEEKSPNMSEKFLRVLSEGFVSVNTAQNILVMKTVSGMAMAVCAAIDHMHYEEIVGSIAGDDTIMMAIKTSAEAELLKVRFEELVSRKQ